MTASTAFALKNSDLNAFLFAGIGTELNGSTLTMLSMLARLDKDPWAEAARLAKLPKNEAVDCLTQSIAKMPLGAESIAEVSATASRLMSLLPVRTQAPDQIVGGAAGALAVPHWLPIALICATLVFGMILTMLSVSVTGITSPIPVAQTVAPATVPSAMPVGPIPQQRN